MNRLLHALMSRRFSALGVVVLALVLLGSAVAPEASAQSTRTLIIRDGAVYLDGQRVPDQQLPASLDVGNLNVQYSFSGISDPVVELNGALYAIGDSLTAVDPNAVSARRSTLFLQGTSSTPNRAETNRAEATAQEQASPLQQQYQAQYLQEMQQRHRQLYDRLMHERRKEAETYDLARTIRQLPEGPERQRYIDSLRTTLDQIFEIKQENRRREIDQLEDQLEELQLRLEKREDMREQMIEQRIRQLIGESAQQQ